MFARHYLRNLGWFLFLELLRCFSSPGSLPTPMYSVWDTFRWVSPFGHLRIKAYLPAPRSFSQAITSFIAYHCQGIHHMLLFTWPYNFDVSNHTLQCSSKLGVVFKECLFGLSPNALCRINLRLISDDSHLNLIRRSNPETWIKRFLSKLKVVWRNQKNCC